MPLPSGLDGRREDFPHGPNRYRDLGEHGPLIFAQDDGEPLHPSEVRKDFRRVLRTAKLPRMRFHDLRHSAASLRLAMGDSPKVVQELLGHSTAAFTLQVYSHLLPGLQEQSAARLESRLLESSPDFSREEVSGLGQVES